MLIFNILDLFHNFMLTKLIKWRLKQPILNYFDETDYNSFCNLNSLGDMPVFFLKKRLR